MTPWTFRDRVQLISTGRIGTVTDPGGCDGGCGHDHCTTVVFDGDDIQTYCEANGLTKP